MRRVIRARALTLIEVVASLVLLATTATALLLAQGRSLEQLRAVREQHMASKLARELITHWKLEPPAPTTAMEGSFGARAGWRWTRHSQPYGLAKVKPLWQVTLTVHKRDHKGENAVSSYTWLEHVDES